MGSIFTNLAHLPLDLSVNFCASEISVLFTIYPDLAQHIGVNQTLLTLKRKLETSCAVCVCVCVAQLCPTLCYSVDCSPPDSSVHGILQARILEQVAVPFSRHINLTIHYLNQYIQEISFQSVINISITNEIQHIILFLLCF